MSHKSNLIILVLIGIVGGALVLAIIMLLIGHFKITDTASIGTIITAIIAFFGTIVSLIYKEVSSFYAEQRQKITERAKDKRQRRDMHWKLVFPLIMEGYLPWIENGEKLSEFLKEAKGKSEDSYEMTRALYFVCLFFGIRLRFILKYGGAIILENKENDLKIKDAYKKLKDKFEWAGAQTPKHVSELQNFFIKHDFPEKPLVFKKFQDELEKVENKEIKAKRKMLKTWLESGTNCEEAAIAISDFVDKFRNEIDKFSGR